MPGLSAKSIRPGESSARFDLTVYVREGEQGLFIQWLYNRDLFKESTIAFMSSSFETLLNSIVSAPEQLIGTMPMLSPAQQKQLLPPESLKTTSLKFPHTEVGQSIPARFAAQVEAYRSRVAIKTRRYEWTYGELDAAARRIAKAIVSHGQPTSQVGLLFEQDAPMVSALLGTLQAGKAYVALDANYPAARLQYMLSDSQSQLLVVDSRTAALAKTL
ncbi:MAG: AMP-binding protein, partial [Cyanobacteria bacterium J06554_11]